MQGGRTRGAEGTLIGALVGGALGFALATAISTTKDCDMMCLNRQPARLRLTPAGAVIGMLVGYSRGKRYVTERWKPVIP